MSYKIGDKVRIRSDLNPYTTYGTNSFTIDMEPIKGKVCTITEIFITEYDTTEYYIKELNGFRITNEMIESKILCDGTTVQLKNGYKCIYVRDALVFDNGNTLRYSSFYNDKLEHKYKKDLSIEKIWDLSLPSFKVPRGETPIYDRQMENKTKEMTIAEIEKVLGYSIKIVKENN